MEDVYVSKLLDATTPKRATRRTGWLHVLLTGIVLFIVTTIVMFLTNNPNLYPTVILVGNFLVPVVFVAFLYDHQHLSSLTPETIAKSFCLGGIVVLTLLYRRARRQETYQPPPPNI